MKRLIFAIVFLTGCTSPKLGTVSPAGDPSQLSADMRSQLLDFKKQVNLPELNQTQLFVLCEAWAASYFLDPAAVISYKNPEAGIIIGRYESANSLHYLNTFTIRVKPGSVEIWVKDPINEAGKNAINNELGPGRAKLILEDWNTVCVSLITYLNNSQLNE